MTFVKDPCGIICVMITYLAVVYADYVVMRYIILQVFASRYVESKREKKSYTDELP